MPSAGAAFIELAGPGAACRGRNAADRSTASRLLSGHLAVPAIALPDTAPVTDPGRVHGLGSFEDSAARSALAAALPAAVTRSLRPRFEWYACRGAFFHHDAHYGDVLFGAWSVGGPQRELVFARGGMRVRAMPGDWVVFDPFEPHAVLDAGAGRYMREHYVDAPVSLFIGFELQLDEEVRRAFGIGPAPSGAPVLASHVAVNAETGALN